MVKDLLKMTFAFKRKTNSAQMYKVFYETSCLSIFVYQQVSNQELGHKQIIISTIYEFRRAVLSWLNRSGRNDETIYVSVAEQSIETFFDQTLKVVIASGGLVLTPKGILAIERNGFSDLPKGHVESGEDIEQAALREVEEETGAKKLKITEKLPSSLHCYQLKGLWCLKRTHWYVMLSEDLEDLKPQTKEGITHLFYVDAQSLDKFLSTTYRSLSEVLGRDMDKLLSK